MMRRQKGAADMSEYSFDALLLAVLAAVRDAQKSLRKQHEQAMNACFGSTEAQHVELAAESEPSMPLVIPLWRFRQRRPMTLKEFSLELGCEIYRRRDERVVVRVVRSRSPEKCAHRIRIEFTGTESTPGKVLLDGVMFRTLGTNALTDPSEDACVEPPIL